MKKFKKILKICCEARKTERKLTEFESLKCKISYEWVLAVAVEHLSVDGTKDLYLVGGGGREKRREKREKRREKSEKRRR